MKVLVVGSGGREHALVWKLARSTGVTDICCVPGNPGISQFAECIPLPPGDIQNLADLARHREIDLTVVGPETPLADGIVDQFTGQGLAIFGPTRAAARLEWSKAFAKDFMKRRGIPTAGYRTFAVHQRQEARAYIGTIRGPLVLKADGLAAGKGVVVCETPGEALPVLDAMLSGRSFGASGETIVIEEFLAGVEASVFAVCDGSHYVLLSPAQDHKRALDGDRGKNTGGMGAFAPTPSVTPEILEVVGREIIGPVLAGMREEGSPYRGCLYIGLMLTATGPRVVEFNCRFGDPESQVVLPLYDGDLAALLASAAHGDLRHTVAGTPPGVKTGASVCVVLASEGYPDRYPTGRSITGLDEAARIPGVLLFHAGTAVRDGDVVTAGGRVLAVTAAVPDGDLRQARSLAYSAVGKISFEGMHFRTDIASLTGNTPARHDERSVP